MLHKLLYYIKFEFKAAYFTCIKFVPCRASGAVSVLHTPIIKYIFEIYLGIICIAVGKNGKENMEGLKTVQLSTVIVTLFYSTLLDDLPVKGLILLDFLVFYS